MNGCRTNTTRWRTSFHSIQITSIGDRRDLRLRSLTPPLMACYSSNPNNSNSYDSGTRSTSIPGSLHQSISSNSTAASMRTCCSKSSTIANRLEKVWYTQHFLCKNLVGLTHLFCMFETFVRSSVRAKNPSIWKFGRTRTIAT